MMASMRRSWIAGVAGLLLVLPLAACTASASEPEAEGTTPTEQAVLPLTTGAIPDQDPEKLQRLYGSTACLLPTPPVA